MTKEMIQRIQLKWGKFSKHQLEAMKGDLDELIGMIQRVYGFTRSQAERELHDFQLTLRPALHPLVSESLDQIGRKNEPKNFCR